MLSNAIKNIVFIRDVGLQIKKLAGLKGNFEICLGNRPVAQVIKSIDRRVG